MPLLAQITLFTLWLAAAAQSLRTLERIQMRQRMDEKTCPRSLLEIFKEPDRLAESCLLPRSDHAYPGYPRRYAPEVFSLLCDCEKLDEPLRWMPYTKRTRYLQCR